MRFFDYIRLAFKNLSRAKARTILTIIAITVGSFSLILMASIIISIRQSIVAEFQNLGAFNLVTVIKDPNSVDNGSLIGANSGDPSAGKKIDDATLAAVKAIPNVAEVTPIFGNFGVNTMRVDGDTKKTWANLVAYDPANDVFNLSLAYGRALTSSDLDKIVIGDSFVKDMGYSGHAQDLIGKHVLLNYRMGGNSGPDWGDPPAKPSFTSNQPSDQQQQNQGIEIPAEIVGITASGTLDNGQSYITLGWGRRLATQVSWQMPETHCSFNQPCAQPQLELVKRDMVADQGYSSLIIKVGDTTKLNDVATAVGKLGYGATTAQAMLDQINKIIFIVSMVLAAVGGISLFVATIGIVNTMVMAAYERTREIGVMRACGATKSAIRRLFTIEAGWLGFWGGICGLVVSIGIVYAAKLLVAKQGGQLGDLPLDSIGQFPAWLVGAVIAFTTALGMVSGFFPALRAARMNPVEALRYE